MSGNGGIHTKWEEEGEMWVMRDERGQGMENKSSEWVVGWGAVSSL